MGQVPQILIIGSGRLATHLSHYFALKNISFQTWSRKTNTLNELNNLVSNTPYRVCLAISDSAIETLHSQVQWHPQSVCIHFSGSHYSPQILGLHPLMTFSLSPYDLSIYEQVPFIGENGRPTLREVFPELRNPFYQIDSRLKPLYHALCVLSGNFTTHLWNRVMDESQEKLELPANVFHLYMTQVFCNTLADARHAMTGPLVRGDSETVRKNIQALDGSTLQNVYQAFVRDFLSQQTSISPRMQEFTQ